MVTKPADAKSTSFALLETGETFKRHSARMMKIVGFETLNAVDPLGNLYAFDPDARVIPTCDQWMVIDA